MITGQILDTSGQLVNTITLQIQGIGFELMAGLILGALSGIAFWLTANSMTRK